MSETNEDPTEAAASEPAKLVQTVEEAAKADKVRREQRSAWVSRSQVHHSADY